MASAPPRGVPSAPPVRGNNRELKGQQGFLGEAPMIPHLRELALRKLTLYDENWAALTEHQVGTRIPDLVLARLDLEAISDRIANALTRTLTATEVRVVRATRTDSGTSISKIAQSVPVSLDHLMRLTSRLVDEGFLETTAYGFIRSPSIRPIVSRLISFEAKRSDWKKAYLQARAHREFAHETYVAFDATYETRFQRAIDHYSSAGIGLVSVSAHGESTRLLVRSRPSRQRLTRAMAWVAETIWERLLRGRTRPLPQTRLPNGGVPSADQEEVLLVGPRPKSLEKLLFDLECLAG